MPRTSCASGETLQGGWRRRIAQKSQCTEIQSVTVGLTAQNPILTRLSVPVPGDDFLAIRMHCQTLLRGKVQSHLHLLEGLQRNSVIHLMRCAPQPPPPQNHYESPTLCILVRNSPVLSLLAMMLKAVNKTSTQSMRILTAQ